MNRYLGCFPRKIFGIRKELKQMNQRTRKRMAMQKALHSRDDVDRVYVSRKGERGLTSIKDSVDISIQLLQDYIQKRGGRLHTASRNNTNTMKTNRTTINRKTTL